MKNLWIATAVAVLAIGCSTNENRLPTPGAPGASPTGGPNNVVVAIPANAASMGTSAFGTNPLTITAGQTVTWVNNDTTAHTVTADNMEFDSGNLAPGAMFQHQFSDEGSFPYHCNIHPSMQGTVVVQASPGPSPSPEPTPTEEPSPSPTPSPSPEPSPPPSVMVSF